MSVARLRVTEVAPRWWRWEILRPDGITVLGADDLFSRAASVLANIEAGSSAGEVDGRTVRWILSLFEGHHSLYASDDGADRLLLFQDGDARIIWRDRLLADHRREWAERIGKVRGTAQQALAALTVSRPRTAARGLTRRR